MSTNRTLEELLEAPPVWKTQNPPSPHIVQFSRIQVLRNLDAHVFPDRAEGDELSNIRDTIQAATKTLDSFKNGWDLTGKRVPRPQEHLLREYTYVPPGWQRSRQSGTLVSNIRDAVVQINGDDHLMLSVYRPGFAFEDALHYAERTLTAMSKFMMFARNGQVGYLTANLADAGPAVRATVALHLPALRMTGRIRPIIRGLEAIGYQVDNSAEDQGKMEDNVILITRDSRFGESAEEIARSVESQGRQVMSFEKDCLQQVLEQAPEDLFDRVSRSYNILRSAYKLSHIDIQRFVSALHLGIDCGMFSQLDHKVVDAIVTESSAHRIQQNSDTPLKRRDIEIERARIVKRALNLLR